MRKRGGNINNFDFVNEPLSTLQLNKIMKGTPGYRGAISRDQLKDIKLNDSQSVIINLDDLIGPGTHWVCLYKTKLGDGYYFDSFGIFPPIEVVNHFYDNLYFSTIEYQHPTSVLCGYYCCYFLLECSKQERKKDNYLTQMDIYDILNKLEFNTLKNEKFIEKYFS